LLKLLPVLDDFERAMANAAPSDLESVWGQGVQLVERNLRGLLAAENLERIPAEGAEFDPREHEALGSQPTQDVPEGHVLHVVRQGYRKGDRVIRPAQVIVASRPA
jgi:molecular chaperone GrpE